MIMGNGDHGVADMRESGNVWEGMGCESGVGKVTK
jgi:hypothetical protein